MPKMEQPKADEKWEIEDDLRALKRVEEIKKDPKRLARAKAYVKKEMSVITSIEDLELAVNEKLKPDPKA